MVTYLKVASGVIFLIDPLQTEEVHSELGKLGDSLPAVDPKAVPVRILENVQDAMTQEALKKSVDAARFANLPVAVTLTKCDVLRSLIQDGAFHGKYRDRLWTSRWRHVGGYDTRIHEDMSGMMGELMMDLHGDAYGVVMGAFPRNAFFGVSPTGSAVERGKYPFLEPWRVEDPLLWLLSQLGVVPTL